MLLQDFFKNLTTYFIAQSKISANRRVRVELNQKQSPVVQKYNE
jgi:hypothetical protein